MLRVIKKHSITSSSHVVLFGLTRVLYTNAHTYLIRLARTTTSSSGPPYTVPSQSITRNGVCGTIATENPLTGYEPNSFDIPEDYDGIDTILRDVNVTQLSNYDFDRQYVDTIGVDDQHLRSEFASPLLTQEGEEARKDLSQTYHSNEESLLRSAPSISERTGKPSSMLDEQRSSQELEDERFMASIQVRREQFRAKRNSRSQNMKRRLVSMKTSFVI